MVGWNWIDMLQSVDGDVRYKTRHFLFHFIRIELRFFTPFWILKWRAFTAGLTRLLISLCCVERWHDTTSNFLLCILLAWQDFQFHYVDVPDFFSCFSCFESSSIIFTPWIGFWQISSSWTSSTLLPFTTPFSCLPYWSISQKR